MSGRFVSAGTAEEPPERDDEWLQAQKELEAAARRKKEDASGLQEGGKSLYEVLQANKAAKQDAFEESVRLKNQFRSLDEDEVDFLDSVLESTRAKDEAVRKETTEQLNAFRRQQEEAEKSANAEQPDEVEAVEEKWHVHNKKRKKDKDPDSKRGFKIRRASSNGQTDNTGLRQGVGESSKPIALPNSPSRDDEEVNEPRGAEARSPQSPTSTVSSTKPMAITTTPHKTVSSSPPANGLGLVDYSSDDE